MFGGNKLVWLTFQGKKMHYQNLHVFKRTKIIFTLGWPYNEGTWSYCDYFIWCVSCTVDVLTCFVICDWVYVWILYCVCVCVFVCVCVCMGFVMCGCFDNCVGILLICVLLFTVFFLYCFLFVYLFLFATNVRTTATEWKLNCSK